MPINGKTKKDVLVEFRHAEILDAARKVFAAKGFDDASVDEIAHTAGVAKGTLYLYYPSKRDIYWEALKCGLIALDEELVKQVNAAESTEAKIRAFIATKMNYFEDNRDFFKIYYAEFGHAVAQPAFYHKDLKEFHFRQMRLLTVALQDGMKRKAIRSLPVEETAFAIVNFTRGVITRRLLGWVKTKKEEDTEFMFDFTWKGIAGR
jgi:AcrR family transcriptional regulator